MIRKHQSMNACLRLTSGKGMQWHTLHSDVTHTSGWLLFPLSYLGRWDSPTRLYGCLGSSLYMPKRLFLLTITDGASVPCYWFEQLPSISSDTFAFHRSGECSSLPPHACCWAQIQLTILLIKRAAPCTISPKSLWSRTKTEGFFFLRRGGLKKTFFQHSK